MMSPLKYKFGYHSTLNKALAFCLCALVLLTGPASIFAQDVGNRTTSRRPPVTNPKAGTNRPAPKPPVRGPQRQQDGSIIGEPWQGEAGVQMTTQELMQQQQVSEEARGPLAAKPIRPRKPKRQKPNRRILPQNPNSIDSPQWPLAARTPVRGARAGLGLRENTTPFAPQTLGTNFNGVTGPTETGAFPPDTMGAIGPSQYFVFVNGRLRTFNEATGTADGVINADPDVFFSSVMSPPPPLGVTFTSDPRVRYDRMTARWFLVIIDVPIIPPATLTSNRILIAVSDAASAGVISAGTVWTFYQFQQDAGMVPASPGFADYPTLGIDNNALYIGMNMFTLAGTFASTRGYVVRKSSVTSGGPIVVTTFPGLAPAPATEGPYTPQGVDNFNPAATEGYFIGVSNLNFGSLVLRRVSDPGGTPTISADILITTTATEYPLTVPHLGNTSLGDGDGDGRPDGNLDALDDRLFAAVMRNGRIWTAHNIGVNNTGTVTTPDRNGSRWYEIQNVATPGTPTVAQSGTVFDTAAANPRYYSIPTIMVSGQNHAAMGFTTAGNNERANAATVGRLTGDTLGTMQTPLLYTASSTAYNPPGDPGGEFGRRWGDYSYVSLDPQDDMTMWAIQEYCSAANVYGTRVVKLIAPPPATPASASGPVTTGQASVNVTITGTAVAGSGFYDPGPNLAPPALPFNHIAATVSGGVVVNNVTYNSPTSVTLNLNTTGATPGTKNVTITNPDGQSLTGNNILTVTNAPATVGQVLISEFRFIGAAGATDEFTELYNNTDAVADISGFTLQSATGGVLYTAPGALGSGTTTIPARGHFLITGAGYSLGAMAASNGTQAGVGNNNSIALFAGTTATAGNRIDSVGFNTTNALFFEGTALTPATGITTNGEYSFVRKMTSASGGLPQDTDNNNNDFVFVSTTGGTFSTRVSIMGAPGPENLASPINRTAQLPLTLIEPLNPSSSSPNRVRTGAGNSGTLDIRRRLTNNTGQPVTRLRFRVVDITTLNNMTAGQADVRPTDSPTTGIAPPTSIGVVQVLSTTIETPPVPGVNGGGLNTALTVAIPGGTLAPGATIDLNFRLNVITAGNYRYFVNIECLP